MLADFDAYLRALASTPIDGKTEHSDRGALEILLQASADDAEPGAHVQHEPRRDKSGGGSPDFKVTRQGRIAGYVEVKAIDENLSKVLKSDQIKKYRKLSDNIVLTDYLEFCWIRPDGEVLRHRLAYSEDLSAKTLRPKAESVEAVRMLLRGFFSATPGKITKSQDLALALASRASMLRDFLTTELNRQESQHAEGRLFALYEAFKVQVFHDLTVPDFTDAFGQMLAYGLFLARLNAGEHQTVTLLNVRQFIPGSFALIRELVRFLEEMNEEEYRDIRWVVDEILSIVNGIDLASIHGDLSFRSRKAISRKVRAGDEEEHRLFERDPFIYFYEDFLKAYDPAMRKSRGVYYTPPPVVNFIVRAIDDILKDKFNIRDGLADHRRVTVLDFATGTGTFLLEVMERIFDNIGGPDAGRADQIVREHVTKNLYGFEYLIAPYTIAHLKLSQYLKDKGHPLQDQERLQVFLTNTLEPVEPQRNLLMPALSAEVEAAQRVKDQPILVITGNPPYQAKSKNKGKWIKSQVKSYEIVDGNHFKEKKHWLNDDYVKFIRFAQLKIDANSQGVVAIITNRWWIENVTFRGMRQSIINTFDKVFIVDLGGESDSDDPDNVFDITKGVAISLLVKDGSGDKSQFYHRIGGSRIEKYKNASEVDVNKVDWVQLSPNSPNYFLVPKSQVGRLSYESWWSIPNIFLAGSTGVLTGKDRLAIALSNSGLHENFKSLLQYTPNEVEAKFGKAARLEISDEFKQSISEGIDRDRIRKIAYRPFDVRYMYDDDNVVFRRRNKVMRHMVRENIAITICRLTKGGDWGHVSVASYAVDDSYVSDKSKERAYAYPLRIIGSVDVNSGVENIRTEFRDVIDDIYGHHFSPEEIVGYIYSILHSPTYRRRYAEFLKSDFPRIPLVETKAQFDVLSDLGWDLVQAHLLRDVPATKPRLGVYHGKGDHMVEAIRYSPDEQAIWINKTQHFGPVPQSVWDFRIGGYQVLDKYLKSRKGRTLSLDEQTHIGDVAESLAFTISQMARIDEAYCEAFPEHGGEPAAHGG